MNKTSIEWTELTWNPVTGCTPISPGCAHCYAKRMAKRLAGRCGYPAAPNEFGVTLHPDRLQEPLKWKHPCRVFVVSMGDLFHEDVPFEYIARVYGIMVLNRQHTFQVLTKRPYRVVDFIHWAKDRYEFARTPPPNIWLGVTAENQEQADKRIPVLLQIPAAVRFVSVEPMLERIDLTCWLTATTGQHWEEGHPESPYPERPGGYTEWWPCLNWVICGGETGPAARVLHPDWVRALRDQCNAAIVPFFFKRWGDNPHPDAFINVPWTNAQVTLPGHGGFLDGQRWQQYPK